jgi:hypothetical protein
MVRKVNGKLETVEGYPNDQCPDDQREDAKDDVGPRRVADQVENGFQRIKRARPDIAKDDPKRG